MSQQLDCDPAFVEAVMRLVRHSDGKPLAAMMLSGDHPKNLDEFHLLVAYLRGDLKRRPGSPGNAAVIQAAELYPKIRRGLDKLERETGRRLRPRREAAIACTLAYLREQGHAVPDDLKKLDNRLNRSKKPRTKKPRIKR